MVSRRRAFKYWLAGILFERPKHVCGYCGHSRSTHDGFGSRFCTVDKTVVGPYLVGGCYCGGFQPKGVQKITEKWARQLKRWY